jgi:plastocyanin
MFRYWKKLPEMDKRSVSGWEKGIIASIAAMVLVIAGIITLAITRSDSDSTQVYTYVISEGTKELLEQGQAPPNQPPTDLALRVGDTLEVVNRDVAVHSYSFITVRPGETGRYTFKTPGTYIGACTIGEHTSVTITVT